MPGTKAGGIKARDTNKERHGEDFYSRIGTKGGHNGRGPNYKGGFAANRELAALAGAIGGSRSSRKGVKNGEGKNSKKKTEQTAKKEKTGLLKRIFGGKDGASE